MAEKTTESCLYKALGEVLPKDSWNKPGLHYDSVDLG